MPTYDYRCDEGHRYEKREPFGSPAQQPCDECGETARRVIHAPPVVFKGSGWYKTDSRPTSKRAATSEGDDSEKSDRVLAAEAATNEREARKESVAAKKKADEAKTTSGGSSSSSDKKS